VVIDNEAGMEHLSRRTTRDVDHLVIVSDPSYRGLVTAGRIAGFRGELDVQIKDAWLVLKPSEWGDAYTHPGANPGSSIPLLGVVPADRKLTDLESKGSPLVVLGDESNVYRAVAAFMEKIA